MSILNFILVLFSDWKIQILGVTQFSSLFSEVMHFRKPDIQIPKYSQQHIKRLCLYMVKMGKYCKGYHFFHIPHLIAQTKVPTTQGRRFGCHDVSGDAVITASLQ